MSEWSALHDRKKYRTNWSALKEIVQGTLIEERENIEKNNGGFTNTYDSHNSIGWVEALEYILSEMTKMEAKR